MGISHRLTPIFTDKVAADKISAVIDPPLQKNGRQAGGVREIANFGIGEYRKAIGVNPIASKAVRVEAKL